MNVRNSAEISADTAIPGRAVSGKTGIRTTMISVKMCKCLSAYYCKKPSVLMIHLFSSPFEGN